MYEQRYLMNIYKQQTVSLSTYLKHVRVCVKDYKGFRTLNFVSEQYYM